MAHLELISSDQLNYDLTKPLTFLAHVELSDKLDYDHSQALNTILGDCTDEQLVAEVGRRKIDVQEKVTTEFFKKSYHVEKEIGHGSSAKVFLVYHKVTKEGFACKMIQKDETINDLKSMQTEIEILKRLRHQNIVSLYEIFESPRCVWLVLELVKGNGLRGVLMTTKHYSEEIASRVLKQILEGVHYLHNQGVIHRDLKLDNLLLYGDIDTGVVKIADFGLSALVKPGTNGYHSHECELRKDWKGLHERWGTATHFSPELIGKKYGPQSDIWAIGCMLYEMLTGCEAFPPSKNREDWKDHKDLYGRIIASRYDKTKLSSLSKDATDLLSQLLEVDPVIRVSSSIALLHLWLEEGLTRMGSVKVINGRGPFANKFNRAASRLNVKDAFRDTINEPSPPRLKEDRPHGHHGLGIFSYIFH